MLVKPFNYFPKSQNIYLLPNTGKKLPIVEDGIEYSVFQDKHNQLIEWVAESFYMPVLLAS